VRGKFLAAGNFVDVFETGEDDVLYSCRDGCVSLLARTARSS